MHQLQLLDVTASIPSKDWAKYERVAADILDQTRDHFGLVRVEGKQSVHGQHTVWEIDAKGLSEGGASFIIIECRQYSSKLKQEDLGAIAYRIQDTGAIGGIVVSPLGLQEGAAKIAAAEKIISVRLSANATPEQFTLEFLGNLLIRSPGVSARCEVGSVTVNTTERK